MRLWKRCVAWPLAIALCMAQAAGAAPQGFVVESWGTREGLPVSSITQIQQDRNGYLWLATFDGLVRFDGARFVTYNSSNTPGLRHARLVKLRQLGDNRLLLISEAGLTQIFDPATEQSQVLTTVERNPGALSWVGPDGSVWLGLSPGLARIERDHLDAVPDELKTLDVSALSFEPDGQSLIGTYDGSVWRWTPPRVERVARPEQLDVGSVSGLLADRHGAIWVGGARGLARIDASGVAPVDRDGVRWTETVHDLDLSDGRLRISAENGVLEERDGRFQPIDPDDQRRAPVLTSLSNPEFAVSASAVIWRGRTVFRLPDTEATRITQPLLDRSGALWLATSGAGLYRLRPTPLSVISEAEGLSAREVYPLHEDPAGGLWIGTQKGGLNLWDQGRMRTFGLADGLLDDNIRAITSDAAGTLWVATHEQSLFRRTADGRFLAEAGAPGPGVRIKALLASDSGRLWMGSDQGLHFRDPDGHWQRDPASDALGNCTVRAIRPASDGALWLATDRCGLARKHGGQLQRFTGEDGHLSDFVRDVLVVDPDTVWTSSEDRGIARLQLQPDGSARTVSIRAAQGLPADGIHQIVDDGRGGWWLGSNRGIARIRRAEAEALADTLAANPDSREQLNVQLFTEAAGLRNREVNGGHQSTALRARDGRLLFATQDGVALIDPTPESLLRPTRPHIESLASVDRRWTAGSELVLEPAFRNLRISYTELLQKDAHQVQFRYRLVGYDDDWILAGTRRTADYAKVPAGSYRFELQAQAGSGWSAAPATLALTLSPRFHETPWFYALMAMSALGLLALAYRARVGWLQRQRRALQQEVALRTLELAASRDAAQEAARVIAGQAEQLRELDRQKSRFFDDLAHELRTPLTLILGPLREVQHGADSTTAVAGAIRNSEVLLELTNQLLDLARLREGKFAFSPQPGDLVALLRASAERFAPLASLRGVGFTLRLPATPMTVALDPRHSGKIVDNLLSNAFKFTPAGGAVELALEAVDERVRIRVSDDGPGIPPELLTRVFERFVGTDGGSERLQPGAGIGLALVHDLVGLHGGRLQVRSEPGAGAVFEVELPLIAASHAQAADAEVLASPASAPTPDIHVEDDDEDRTTVLIVDDHAEIRAHIRQGLGPQYRLLEAADGIDALALARARLPDLIVADVSMPRLDGYALCAELRRDPELEGVPVILLTARAGIDDRIEGLQAAADDYLTKPFDARELRARIANLIELRRRLQRRLLDSPAAPRRQLEAAAEAEGTPVASGPNAAGGSTSEWQQRLFETVDLHLADEGFKVAELADAMGLERTQLFRRVREETGLAPSDLLRERRLQRGAELLRTDPAAIGEIAFAVGFSSVAYFTKCFRERFGCTPGQYRSLRQDSKAA